MPRDICLRFNTPGSANRERAPAPLPEHRVVRLYISELSVIDGWRSEILALTLQACIGSTRVGAILLLCGDRASWGALFRSCSSIRRCLLFFFYVPSRVRRRYIRDV